ncbi:aminotransferase class IV [Actinoplanes xinjiangensis]|uniref:Branched-chain amino acid aminotransferase n=1 Tax=Actinoplanes xinjiangensis TaxID=512350 RepID=A0A316FMZ7_9ACTN|nr:aminotransferase class IV [Actinoplanes xinjiangensis]PWK49026.1 branched-chain amino acid aminotransferase [Actinoplanes xinjiangensis]GIF38733.1 aminotransferase class IV [Actinoplanes xinjiangensis]
MLQRYDERNAGIQYWVNGTLLHRDQPGLSPFDSVVQGGDAVWEGLRLYRGAIFGLHPHLARLRRSALALGFADIPSDDTIIEAITATLRANEMVDGVHIRLTLTRGVKVTSGMDPRLNRAGPTLIVLAEHKPPVYDTGGLTLATSSIRRPSPDVLDPKIHHNNLINSILAKIEANAAGADDALMLDQRGFVAETNATHLFAVLGGRLVTPTTAACPEGITRQTVLDLAARHDIPAVVRDVSLTEMYTADEVFCTGTMGEIAAVTTIDGRRIGDGKVGPLTSRVAKIYQEHAAANGVRLIDA